MRFQGAVVREQGVTFAVVVVQRRILDNNFEANRAVESFRPAFPGMPVTLMAQDHRGRPTYYGRADISRFLAGVPLGTIPWREYSLN